MRGVCRGVTPAAPAVFDLETRLDLTLSTTDALAEFHDFHVATRDRLARALALVLGDVERAADAVDAAMVPTFQRWVRVRRRTDPAAWVFKQAIAHARTRAGHRRRHPEVEQPELAPGWRKLSVTDRGVVVCRLLLEWSDDDTATALGIRPAAVGSRLRAALAELGDPRHASPGTLAALEACRGVLRRTAARAPIRPGSDAAAVRAAHRRRTRRLRFGAPGWLQRAAW